MDFLIEFLGELLLLPFLSFFDCLSLKKLGKYEDVIKAIIIIIASLAFFGLIVGIVFLYNNDLFLAGVYLSSICGSLIFLYLISCIWLYKKKKK